MGHNNTTSIGYTQGFITRFKELITELPNGTSLEIKPSRDRKGKVSIAFKLGNNEWKLVPYTKFLHIMEAIEYLDNIDSQ
ncbi:hypothetical protein [Limnobacter sp.]|uniref:hypothetical protein n=1 Tax=Limnobacter sp. TaxID=2003368 RepID=UPI0025C55F24|nr:hypothetical protein [Limnobacter sp.]